MKERNLTPPMKPHFHTSCCDRTMVQMVPWRGKSEGRLWCEMEEDLQRLPRTAGSVGYLLSPTFATRKTGQNCLSAEFQTPRNFTGGGRHAAGTLPGQKSSVFNNIRWVEADYKTPTRRQRHVIEHRKTIIAPHTGAAGGPDLQVLFQLSATSTDVKIRAGSHLSLPPGSVLMLSIMWKSHCLSPLHFTRLLQTHFEQWHIPSSKMPTVLYSAPPSLKAR